MSGISLFFIIFRMVRSSKKENIVENKLKTWLKRNDPDYVRKMKDLSKNDDVKTKRNYQSRIRRAGHSACYAVFRKFSPLKDSLGNEYVWNDKYKRLLKNSKEVVRRARDSTLHYIPYSDEEDLDDSKFDEPIVTEVDSQLCESVEKLFDGDEELHQKMKSRKFVVIREIDDDDCFWKRLTDQEKKKLLKKLKRNNVK